MRRLTRFVQKVFCLESDFSQNQGSGPELAETDSDSTAAGHRPVQRTTKDDQELWNGLLGVLDKEIQDETLNPTRRLSIQLCRDFVKEHGYPVEDYYIYAWATHGIVIIMNENQIQNLPRSVERSRDSFILVSSNMPNLSRYSARARARADDSSQAAPEYDDHLCLDISAAEDSPHVASA
ncbi:hypothetical protein Daus18300_007400 [Diaporthe australafricana]|uniref:Uncharacterized protein n=1 Tax=Diaporthe australafricana TaxID=127596 RepID=A0ABR3WN10_9PEZI